MNHSIIGRLVVSLTRNPIPITKPKGNWFTFSIDNLSRATILAHPIELSSCSFEDDTSEALLVRQLESNTDTTLRVFVTSTKQMIFAYKGGLYHSVDDPFDFTKELLNGIKFVTTSPECTYANTGYPNAVIVDFTNVFDFNLFTSAARVTEIMGLARSGTVSSDIGYDEVPELKAREIIGFRKHTSKLARVDGLWVVLHRDKNSVLHRYSLKWLLDNLKNKE